MTLRRKDEIDPAYCREYCLAGRMYERHGCLCDGDFCKYEAARLLVRDEVVVSEPKPLSLF